MYENKKRQRAVRGVQSFDSEEGDLDPNLYSLYSRFAGLLVPFRRTLSISIH